MREIIGIIQARPYVLDKVMTDLVQAVRDRAMEVE